MARFGNKAIYSCLIGSKHYCPALDGMEEYVGVGLVQAYIALGDYVSHQLTAEKDD